MARKRPSTSAEHFSDYNHLACDLSENPSGFSRAGQYRRFLAAIMEDDGFSLESAAALHAGLSHFDADIEATLKTPEASPERKEFQEITSAFRAAAALTFSKLVKFVHDEIDVAKGTTFRETVIATSANVRHTALLLHELYPILHMGDQVRFYQSLREMKEHTKQLLPDLDFPVEPTDFRRKKLRELCELAAPAGRTPR
jgi:hypothetical protein